MEGQVLCVGWTNEDRITRDHGYVGVLLCLLPMLPSRTHFYFVVLYTFLSVDDRLVIDSESELLYPETQNPDRIIIECSCVLPLSSPRTMVNSDVSAFMSSLYCSGSAFPATLAFQIRELERETNHALALDAIVTVIDAENFRGYEDTSMTARMQAQYTDVILIVRRLALFASPFILPLLCPSIVLFCLSALS